MCCQLPTVKLPDWTPKNTHPPWGQSAPLRGKLFPPRQHWHFAFCHKIGGNRKWHQEPFAHFTQETLPRPMLYTAVDDLGEQKGTLLFPLFLFYFFTYCNIFFCTRWGQGRHCLQLSSLAAYSKELSLQAALGLQPASWTIQIQAILLPI